MRKLNNRIKGDVLLPLMIIIVVSFAVYFNALFNGFVYDDVFQVTENQWITNIRYIPEIFTQSVWGFQAWAASSNYYRPLMHLVYMMSYYLFGLKPWGFHLVNIIFHAANSVLIFLLAPVFLSGSAAASEKGEKLPTLQNAVLPALPRPEGSVRRVLSYPPFIAALLFAVHPIHTEAVTWVAGLPEVSFTFFSLLCLYLFVRSQGGFNKAYWCSVAFFFISTLCKETALTVLIILAAYEPVFRKEGSGMSSLWKRLIPFGVAAGVYFLMRFYALGGLAPEKKHAYLNTYQYVVNIFPLFSQYLWKLIAPTNLNAFYVFHPIYSIFEVKGILSLGVTVSFVVLAVMALKKSKAVFFSLLVIGVPLLPVLYIPGLGENTFAERYLYLPSAGFAVMAAMLLAWVSAKSPKGIVASAVAFLIIAGFFSIGTVKRNAAWKDDLALYSDTAKKSPDGFIPNNNFGFALLRAGRAPEAMEQLKIALGLKPDMLEILINKSVSCIRNGQTDKAMLNLSNVLFMEPGRVDAHYYLGLTYSLKGWANQAIDEYMTVLRLKPGYPHIHNNLAEVYAMQGRVNEATAEYEAALKTDPADAQARNNIGVLYLQEGNIDKAIEHFQLAVNLKPDDATFRKNLDNALSMRSALNK